MVECLIPSNSALEEHQQNKLHKMLVVFSFLQYWKCISQGPASWSLINELSVTETDQISQSWLTETCFYPQTSDGLSNISFSLEDLIKTCQRLLIMSTTQSVYTSVDSLGFTRYKPSQTFKKCLLYNQLPPLSLCFYAFIRDHSRAMTGNKWREKKGEWHGTSNVTVKLPIPRTEGGDPQLHWHSFIGTA